MIADMTIVIALTNHRHIVLCYKTDKSHILVVIGGEQTRIVFVFGAGPSVLQRARDINAMRRIRRNKEVLIEGKLLLAIDVLQKALGEPIGEIATDINDSLPVLIAEDGGAGASGIVRDCAVKARI